MARQLKPYMTAISRTEPSEPVRWLVENGYIEGEVLDYGCGKGKCAEFMGADKYDPYHYRRKIEKKYDTITCNYVLNVITEEESEMVLEKIKKLLKPDGVGYITVRRDVKGEVYTVKKTRQRDVILGLPTVHKTSTYEIYRLEKD